jgi:uncharacterized protein
MQTRDFGRTGLKTSILGYGGFHLIEIPVHEVDYLLNSYLDAGGNYIETAAGYGNGESEMKIGKTVSHRRTEYILTTKTGERNMQGCLASIDRSLENLNTDYIDLLLMHAVGTIDDLEIILGKGGALEGAEKARNAGKIRFIGISMHGQPDVLIKALNEYNYDAVMTTINYYDKFNYPEIEDVLIPLANKKRTAIILMKPLADGLLWKSSEQAFKYAFSQDVSVVVTGINNREMLENDLRYAGQFEPMTQSEKENLYKSAPELGNYVCRQCGKCLPCPEGLDIPAIFKYEGYFDRQMANGVVTNAAEYALKERLRFWYGNNALASARYGELDVKADKCTKCGDCLSRCPYDIDIIRKLSIVDYKFGNKKLY